MTAPASAPEPIVVSAEPRLAGPWVRYGARMADVLLFAVLLDRTPLWNTWLPNWFGTLATNPLITGIAAALAWAPFEAITLAFTGRTPGKWLFGAVVRRADGKSLSVWAAFSRSIMVLIGGLGCGIRPLALACFLVNYGGLIRGRQTFWDQLCRSRVCLQDDSVARLAIGAVVTLALLWLLVESRMNATPAGGFLIASM